MTVRRPRPRLDDDNRAFWTGGADGRLHLMRCGDCSRFTHPPRRICRNCLSENIAPHAVSGTGVVDTYTVNHQKWAPWMEPPFVIARVRLDDAPEVVLTTNIVGCSPEDVDIGDPVRVVFEAQDEIWYPLFEKAAPHGR